MASTAPLAPRANVPIGHAHDDAPAINGNHVHNDPRPPPAPPAAGTPSKKDRKAKKALDSNEASKLVAQRISQLEHDAAGEKDQEAEIGACYFPPSTTSRGLGTSGSGGRMRHADYGGGGSPDGTWRQTSRPDLPLEIEAPAPRRKETVIPAHDVEGNRLSGLHRSCHTGTMLLMYGQCRAGGAQGES